jgi:hypothetical protein
MVYRGVKMKWITAISFLVIDVLFGQRPAQAQNQEQSVSTTSSQLEKLLQPKKLEDPLIITDQKLRADEGSLSRYSVKVNLSYAGPGITDLENKDQPNPDHVVNTFQTKLIGSVGARYRIDGVNAVNAGTGVTAIHPLHGWERTDVNSPFMSYDHSSRAMDIQMRQTLNASLVTVPEYSVSGEVAATYYELDLVKELGLSRFSAGFDTKLDYFLYSRSYLSTGKSDRGAAQNYISFYPNLKFKVTDKLNLNSSLSFMFYNARQIDDRLALWSRTLTQKIGIGYSFARDVYFNPYVTIYPRQFASDTTTFNLGAVFSIL